jgi:hypothetical protein
MALQIYSNVIVLATTFDPFRRISDFQGIAKINGPAGHPEDERDTLD